MTKGAIFDLSGKSALVTGGRRGIGLAIAHSLAEHGADVTITGTQGGEESVEGFPLRRMQLSDPASIQALADGFDGLDILVNNAGELIREGKEYEPDNFDRIIHANLNGTYRMCHAFRPHLEARRGCIVNVVSMRAFIGSPLGPAYGASKAGIMQLTRTLAIHWGADGIRANAVAPGWTRTDMNISVQQDADAAAEIANSAALNRWGEPREIAGAVVYLASPAASFTTGTCIVADGGFMA
jgi:NAD(P)-dependent dehydrogenase (short-subunit alcohol dehydrogenase family)